MPAKPDWNEEIYNKLVDIEQILLNFSANFNQLGEIKLLLVDLIDVCGNIGQETNGNEEVDGIEEVKALLKDFINISSGICPICKSKLEEIVFSKKKILRCSNGHEVEY